MTLERKLRNKEYEVERLGHIELVGDKWKLNHRVVEEQINTAKKDTKIADQTLKESCEKQKAGRLLAVNTLKLNHEMDVGKLKIEQVRDVIQLKANSKHIKQFDDEMIHLRMRDMMMFDIGYIRIILKGTNGNW